jgi:amino acid adenylation domain-containing protein
VRNSLYFSGGSSMQAIEQHSKGKKGIHELFEEQVERTPQVVAVVFEDQQLTYYELNCRANQLAHYLRKQGVGPEMLVGICLERSLEMVVGLLGILKAGGAYVPLDPQHPRARLESIRQDAHLKMILGTSEALADWDLAGNDVQLVSIHEAVASNATQLDGLASTLIAPQQLAYVLYTSGTTGTPKGVMVEHHSVVALLLAFEQVAASSEHLIGTSLCPFNFDVSVWEFFSALCFGGTLHILVPDVFADSGRLASYLVDQRITSAYLPPALLTGVASELEKRPERIVLGRILVGVEPIKQSVLQRFRNLSDGLHIVNGYGPTETTICATFFNFQSMHDPDQRTPIGTAVSGYEVYILDQHFQPVSGSVAGELYIGGVGVARGYLNRPEMTAEKFRPDPFSNELGKRLYKTGDLARWLPDGNIEFLGRSDHQIKLRGFRIELGEIEAVLEQYPVIHQAVIVAREDVPGDKRLIAYLVLRSREVLAVNDMRAFLKAKLPEYMLPTAFVALDVFPLTPNGKIDRYALPAPEQDQTGLAMSHVAPRSPIEEILAGIWANVLGLTQVGIHDSFFDLGGHSLLATQVISRIRNTFQVELSLRTLFEVPTVAGLAEQVQTIQRTAPTLQAIQSVNRESRLPLSYAQERLWFLEQLAPGNSTYNIPIAYRLHGRLDTVALERSLNEMVRRHEGLRTTFVVIDEQPVQVIAPTLRVTWPIVDLRHLTEAKRAVKAQRLVNEETQRPFDMTRGPLLRAALWQLGEDEYLLALTLHHIVSDGWSMEVFNRELSLLYTAFVSDQPSPLADLPIQYRDFAVWQRQWLQGEALESQLAYWKQQLAGSPSVLELPTDRPRPAAQTYHGTTYSFMLSPALSESLKALSQQEGVTLFMTLLAAFKVLLYRYTGQRDLVVGTPIANRNRVELEGLIGFFVNTLVLRTEVSGALRFREVLSRVREVCLGAYAHQDLPFEKLVEVLHPERDMSHNPLFQVMFVLQNSLMGTLSLGDLIIHPLELAGRTALFDLTLSAEETPGGLKGTWEYNTDLFDTATIVRMTGHLQTLLAGVVTHPDKRLSELPLLTPEERHQLLIEWNNTKTIYPEDKCIHELFEDQVERTPNTDAVVFEDQRLTYRELNCRANQLAHYLRQLGVGPEVLVGLCLERSLEMVVGLLGILKAGGAYVPLDPQYPQARLDSIHQDADLKIILGTTETLADWVAGNDLQLVEIREVITSNATRIDGFNPARNTPDQLAYVLYTSGTTGTPKGVMIEHHSVLALLQAFEQVAASGEHFIGTSICPFNFDVSVWEFFSTLCFGGTLHILLPDVFADAERFASYLIDHQITSAYIPPALLPEVADGLDRRRARIALKRILVGVEPIKQNVLQRFRNLSDEMYIVNGYGPTETTICATFFNFQSMFDPNQRTPIGTAVLGYEVYIVDQHLQPVPVGVTGELYIGGVGVARGYLNRPELTVEKFIPDPFNNELGTRLYKTGDLARWLPDGNIEFLGRIDHQVKIRGFRIELGEIEAVLGQYPGVQAAIVVAREDVPGDKRLVAYIVSDQASRSTANDLQRFLMEKLPKHMFPATFVMLDAFPLTPNGKIDRRALPAPNRIGAESQMTYLTPRTCLEEVLSGIWVHLLNLDRIGINDSFFVLGGHSLLAARLMARVQDVFHVGVSLRSFFEEPTVAGLAASILRHSDKSERIERTAQLLMQISQLSDEEVQAMLVEEDQRRKQEIP